MIFDRYNLTWWQNWPPLPPVEGMLGKPGYAKNADYTKPRDEWGIEEWKAYSVHLERHGARLVDEIKQAKTELYEKSKKLSRRKKPLGSNQSERALLISILSGKSPIRPKRGRKPTTIDEKKDLTYKDLIMLTKFKIDELEQRSGEKATVKQAIELVCEEYGIAKYRVRPVTRSIQTRLSELKKSQNKKVEL